MFYDLLAMHTPAVVQKHEINVGLLVFGVALIVVISLVTLSPWLSTCRCRRRRGSDSSEYDSDDESAYDYAPGRYLYSLDAQTPTTPRSPAVSKREAIWAALNTGAAEPRVVSYMNDNSHDLEKASHEAAETRFDDADGLPDYTTMPPTSLRASSSSLLVATRSHPS